MTVDLAPFLPERVQFVSATGMDITLGFTEPIPAAQRGTLLLDAEDAIREATGLPFVVWHEPLGDRNSLRNLRGIEVKR